MRKILVKLFIFELMSFILFISQQTAFAKTYTLDEALSMVETGEDRIQLSGDFNKYNVINSENYKVNSGKYIVLYRVGPEKEYTISYTPFDEAFEGIDLTEPQVYLDLDKMKLIPEEYRAKTVEEIGNIIMLEGFYVHSGTITSRVVDSSDDYTDLRTLQAIMNGSEPSEEQIDNEEQNEGLASYKAVFHGVTAISLFNSDDGSSLLFDAELFPHAELRSNPQAADIADTIYSLINILKACLNQDTLEFLIQLQEYIDVETEYFKQLVALTEADTIDYSTALQLTYDEIWRYAETICDADPNNADYYKKVIENRLLNGLLFLIQYGDYTGVDKDDADIVRDKDYIGRIDYSVLETVWTDVADVMNILSWDTEVLSIVFQME